MMQDFISPDLHRFKSIILSLIPYAVHEKLDFLIVELTPSVSDSVRYCIKLEIRKLAKPCENVIDLRLMFDDCEEYTHENISHYLDQISKALFVECLDKNNGLYTLSVYQEINLQANERHSSNQKAAHNKKTDLEKLEDTLNIPLINKNILEHFDLNFNSHCKSFVYDPLGMSYKGKNEIGVKTEIIDINKSSAVIAIDLEMIKEDANKVYLWLYDHHKATSYEKEIIMAYNIKEYRKTPCGKRAIFLLSLCGKETEPTMNKRFNLLFNKKTIAVKNEKLKFISPLFDSVNSRIHEQYFLNNFSSLPILYKKESDNWIAQSILKNKINNKTHAFLANDAGHSIAPNILSSYEVQARLNNGNIDDFVVVMKSTDDSNVKFNLIWLDDFINDLSAKNIFNKYFSNGFCRVFKVKSVNIDPEVDMLTRAAIPSSVSTEMALLNMPLTQPVLQSIGNVEKLVTFTDATELFSELCARFKDDTPSLYRKLPVRYRMPVYTFIDSLNMIETDTGELRTEDRFDESFNVVITEVSGKKTNIQAKTNNISAKGLSLSTLEAVKLPTGEDIKISIDIPIKGKVQQLKQQSYQVIGSASKKNIRLVIRCSQSSHQACQLIKQYAYLNRDTLKISGLLTNAIHGLDKAVKNVISHNHCSIPFYITHEKRFSYIRSYSSNQNTMLEGVYDSENPRLLENLFSSKRFSNTCVNTLNKTSESDSSETLHIILLARPEKEDSESVWFRVTKDFNRENLLTAYEKLKTLGEPKFLKVTLSKTSRPLTKYYISEMNELWPIDTGKCETLISEMQLIKGIGEIEDVTPMALCLIEKNKVMFS